MTSKTLKQIYAVPMRDSAFIIKAQTAQPVLINPRHPVVLNMLNCVDGTQNTLITQGSSSQSGMT